MPAERATGIFRFGVFELDSAAGELRKSGVRLRLQDQPFQVLSMLVQRPGQLVSREEFRKELWPADTFVDFDHSLNTIVNKLREVLGDSASNPRFVETLAKRGYRFLPPVEFPPSSRATNSESVVTPQAEVLEQVQPSRTPASRSWVLTNVRDLPIVPSGYVRMLFVLIQIMYLSFYMAALGRLSGVQGVLERSLAGSRTVTVLLIVSASIGIPVRLYLISYVSFDVKDLSRKFLRLFAGLLMLDELWALAPFLLAQQIGIGFALAISAALIYVPFAQRTLVLMRDRSSALT
jgi:DNA-binding winged helix-turn-helix (wHTH) protein